MKKGIFFTPLLVLFSLAVLAQKKHFCANTAYDSLNNLRNPSRAIQKLKFEQAVQNYIIDNKSNARISATNEIIRIPVVVHIIHNQIDGSIKGSNIPDEQIYSQIRVLNEDYRRKAGTLGYNTNPVGADTEIEFFLPTIDPTGNPTTGITRNYLSTSEYNLTRDADRQRLSNLNYWDSNKYLNIWVAAFRDPYIGYGEFPYAETIDGLTDDIDESLDGVFIDYRVFGKKSGTNTSGLYSFGRTTTHEVGHWLGLIHIWGDEYCGTDYVEDTPPTEGANNSSECKIIYSNCNGTRTRNLIEDYMDYSPDSCMNLFTEGQKQRMRAALDLSKRRKRVVTFAKFQLPPSNTVEVSLLPNPTTTDNITVQILLPDFQNFTITLTDILGRNVYTESFNDFPSTIVTLKTHDLTAGNYIINVNSTQWQVKKRLAVF